MATKTILCTLIYLSSSVAWGGTLVRAYDCTLTGKTLMCVIHNPAKREEMRKTILKAKKRRREAIQKNSHKAKKFREKKQAAYLMAKSKSLR